jgi:hypothetical protein
MENLFGSCFLKKMRSPICYRSRFHIRPYAPLSMVSFADPYDYDVFRGELPCKNGRIIVFLDANRKSKSTKYEAHTCKKAVGFLVELREVECLRSLLLGTCILLAFSHFFIANEYKEIQWLH